MNIAGRARYLRPRPVLAAVIAGLLAVATLTASFTGSASALTGPSPGTYSGDGFDACTAPAQDVMDTWLANSAYQAVGIYMGGVNRGCAQPLLTAQWVGAQQAAGWHLIPIYMGLQPYCTTSTKKYRFTGADAATSGRAAADDAVVQARALGLSTGSTIYSDIEAYSPTDSACSTAVLTYQSEWTQRLHALGFFSGFYSSLGSGVRDQVAVYDSTGYVRPDYLWFARYDGIPTVSDPSIPNTYWLHRRIKQYRGGALETYGGKTLNVDRDLLDVGPMPAALLGDFTGDGWSDLIARQSSSGLLYLYPGTSGGFPAMVQIGAGWNSMDSITRFGDFNLDGREDVIARESATGALWLYRGNGAGFPSRVKIGLRGWNGMREITPIGDFNGDGYPDLVAVETSTGNLYYYPGLGNSLAPRLLLGTGWNAMDELVGIGDFNRDGRVDLIARQSATGDLWFYPGTAIGLPFRVLIGTGWNSMRDLVSIGDFNHDGTNDLFAVEKTTGGLFLYPGVGASFPIRMLVGTGWTANYRPVL
jgi:Domain of unknown function (DUF1906)/FG-GAP-like repeat